MIRLLLVFPWLAGCHATVTPGCDRSYRTIAPDERAWPGLTPNDALALANDRAPTAGLDVDEQPIVVQPQFTADGDATLSDGIPTSTRKGPPISFTTSHPLIYIDCSDSLDIPVVVSVSIDTLAAPLVLPAELTAREHGGLSLHQAFVPAEVGFVPPDGPWLDDPAATYRLSLIVHAEIIDSGGTIYVQWDDPAGSGDGSRVETDLFAWGDPPRMF